MLLSRHQSALVASAKDQWLAVLTFGEQQSQRLTLIGLRLIRLRSAQGDHKAIGPGPVLQLNQPAYGPIGEAHTEHSCRVVVATQPAMPEIAGLHRAHALRSFEQWNDQTFFRVAANPIPGAQIKNHQAEQQQRAQAQTEVIQQQLNAALPYIRPRYQARRPIHGNRQAVIGRQGLRGEQAQVVVALLDHLVRLALLTVCSGIGGQIANPRARRQFDLHRGLKNREYPLIPGDVPVQLVAIGVMQQLPFDPITQLVLIAPRLQ